MLRKIIFVVGCLAIAGCGCGMREASVQTEQAQHQLRAIVHIETRNEVTTVMSGPNGRVYTVRARDGSILEEQVSELELLTKFPTIHHLMKTSYAGDGNYRTAWAGGSL